MYYNKQEKGVNPDCKGWNQKGFVLS
jgi:hypothetical protein